MKLRQKSTLTGSLFISAFIYIFSAGSLLGEEEFYKIGSNQIEFRNTAQGAAFLDQNDLAALALPTKDSLKGKQIRFYIKIGSLHKIREYLIKSRRRKPKVFINGRLIPGSRVPFSSFPPNPLYAQGSLTVFSTKKKGIPVAEIRKKARKAADVQTGKRYRRLLEWVRKRQKQEPNNLELRSYLVSYFGKRKECEQAAILIGKPGLKRFHFAMVYNGGSCFLRKEHFLQAAKFYTRIYKEYGASQVLPLRSEAYSKSGQYPLALRDLNDFLRFVSDKPDDYYIFRTRARLFVKLKRYEEAIQDYNRLIKEDPTAYIGHQERADLYIELKQIDAAIKDYKVLIKLRPTIGGPYNQLAWTYVSHNRNLQEALKLSLKSLEIYPDTPAYMDTLAEIYFKLGNLDKAQDITEKALRKTRNAYLRKALKARLKKIRLGRKR